MLLEVHPKLPMRQSPVSQEYYIERLQFQLLSNYGDYLILRREAVELHLFSFPQLNPLENATQVYIRVRDIEALYQELRERGVDIHPNGELQLKPWGQTEFSLLDPDHNLLTFGETAPPSTLHKESTAPG
jgi:hypothetical protein